MTLDIEAANPIKLQRNVEDVKLERTVERAGPRTILAELIKIGELESVSVCND